MRSGLQQLTKGTQPDYYAVISDSIPSAMYPGHVYMESTGTPSGECSGSSSLGTAVSVGTAVSEQCTAPIPPCLSHVEVGIAELALVTRPILLWQFNLRLRKLGLPLADNLGQALRQTLAKSLPQEYVTKSRQALEDLLISKGGTVNLADKAPRQWHRITSIIECCETYKYPLGRRLFDESDVAKLEQLIVQPRFDHVREAAQMVLLVAREVIAAGQ